MPKKLSIIYLILLFFLGKLNAQPGKPVSISYKEGQRQALPGQVVNLAFFIENNNNAEKVVTGALSAPGTWKVISKPQTVKLNPSGKELLLFTIQVPGNCPVGNYELRLLAVDPITNITLKEQAVTMAVKEIEKISILFVESQVNVKAGETFRATYLLQNLGNTKKKVFIETYNCDVEGTSAIEIEPGKTKQFKVYKQTSPDLLDAREENFSVRAAIDGGVKESMSRSFTVFPSKEGKKDLFFRFPVSVSGTYIISNQKGKPESGYQFEVAGSGPLDLRGKHQLDFLARGPNNTDLSYIGLYNQYYASYSNKNASFFVGQKGFRFTPLTESSRFGTGVENKIILNNGLYFGFIYVKPRFYADIKNELAVYTGLKFDKDNEINLFYISKEDTSAGYIAHMASLEADFKPFKKTNVKLEFSQGFSGGAWDNAFRTSLNTNFSIFNIAGNYYYAGKNYPGYYSNSIFYSGNISARITKKMNVGISAREDFKNAELDTFFVSAPYSKTYRAYMNYNIARRAHFRFYWREYERKDRLTLNKFHYKTRSLNSQFNHRFRKIEYRLSAEAGKTTNFLLGEGHNKQNTFRGDINFGYHFNSKNKIRLFGGWSNVNSFVSGEQRNITAGISGATQITRNLKADLSVRNAYDIDNYYRNRNLMQFSLKYKLFKKHSISARSFYTIFRKQVGDPEFSAALTYTYKLGAPLKKIINAGDIKGRVTYGNGEPAEGIVLNLQNKTAITNSNGEFLFSTVQPGRHLLFVDRTEFEINEITNIPAPMEIEVLEDQVASINFQITKGAKLTGNFLVVESSADILQKSGINAGDIIVELKNEFEQFRIKSNEQGGFSFPIIRPGKYTFKIYTNSVPNGYEVKQPVFQLDFQPGENKQLQIKLTSKKRKIIFKSESTLPLTLKGEKK